MVPDLLLSWQWFNIDFISTVALHFTPDSKVVLSTSRISIMLGLECCSHIMDNFMGEKDMDEAEECRISCVNNMQSDKPNNDIHNNSLTSDYGQFKGIHQVGACCIMGTNLFLPLHNHQFNHSNHTASKS